MTGTGTNMSGNTTSSESNLLLPTIIDRRAQLEPDRLFCILLETEYGGQISGTNQITYSNYSNAVNMCAWWLDETLGHGPGTDILGYFGPPDLRYSIIALAAAKTSRQAGSFN